GRAVAEQDRPARERRAAAHRGGAGHVHGADRRRRGRARPGHRAAHGPAIFPVLMDPVALLLLTDSRYPAGGHAHSGGLEAAVAAGRVTGVAELEAFLRGRLATAGRVVASFAAAAHGASKFAELDAELDART